MSHRSPLFFTTISDFPEPIPSRSVHAFAFCHLDRLREIESTLHMHTRVSVYTLSSLPPVDILATSASLVFGVPRAGTGSFFFLNDLIC